MTIFDLIPFIFTSLIAIVGMFIIYKVYKVHRSDYLYEVISNTIKDKLTSEYQKISFTFDAKLDENGIVKINKRGSIIVEKLPFIYPSIKSSR